MCASPDGGYPCIFEGCDRVFSRQVSLSQHVMYMHMKDDVGAAHESAASGQHASASGGHHHHPGSGSPTGSAARGGDTSPTRLGGAGKGADLAWTTRRKAANVAMEKSKAQSKYYKRRGLTSLAPSPTNQSDATSTSGQSAHGVGRRPHQSRPPLRALLKRDDDAFLADCRRRVDQLSDVIDFESMCAITSPVVVGRRSRKRAPKEAGGTAGDDVTEELVQWEPLSIGISSLWMDAASEHALPRAVELARLAPQDVEGLVVGRPKRRQVVLRRFLSPAARAVLDGQAVLGGHPDGLAKNSVLVSTAPGAPTAIGPRTHLLAVLSAVRAANHITPAVHQEAVRAMTSSLPHHPTRDALVAVLLQASADGGTVDTQNGVQSGESLHTGVQSGVQTLPLQNGVQSGADGPQTDPQPGDAAQDRIQPAMHTAAQSGLQDITQTTSQTGLQTDETAPISTSPSLSIAPSSLARAGLHVRRILNDARDRVLCLDMLDVLESDPNSAPFRLAPPSSCAADDAPEGPLGDGTAASLGVLRQRLARGYYHSRDLFCDHVMDMLERARDAQRDVRLRNMAAALCDTMRTMADAVAGGGRAPRGRGSQADTQRTWKRKRDAVL